MKLAKMFRGKPLAGLLLAATLAGAPLGATAFAQELSLIHI